MCSVSAAASTASSLDATPLDSLPSPSVSLDSFSKDGRKISVGDCALFQAGNSPPFIGIIRSLISNKDDPFKLIVNWLYRPADVKLSKGILLEAAPNEIFYSFHKDEIPVASLLHPCKVAFLRKGIELPSGISSFVCRRVYDIQNKCLWWLTDQDYINEHQEEVDQLLDKTRLEMHAAVQPGARSPKPLNGPTSSQQLKSGSDSVQNSTTSFTSQGKSKKKERGDQGLEPVKRERSSKVDDGDSGLYRPESMIKSEIAKITDKGGLVSFEGVDKLVQIMHLDRSDKKIDMAGRLMVADVIAATDKYDCLERFVQLKGVPVLDDWLQEAHKGKVGDGKNPKENDKSTEEFLLALLRALDKLPVNLQALQTCNVGKSVNNLRSHKNIDIQKKARSLVDTWKKRVDLEIKKSEAKSPPNQSSSCSGKPGFSENSHGGTRRSGSAEVSLKSIITQPSASRTGSSKTVHVDSVSRTTPTAPGSMKLTPSSPVLATVVSKDPHYKDMLPTTKEEKSSSSSQSQNNSQSCSSDHAKNAFKEDARSSTAGSTKTRTSTSSSRTRKSSNGILGPGGTAVQKESILGKPGLLNRNNTSDKTSQVGPTCERSVELPSSDPGNSHRLIVRLPNPGRSPARSASGGSMEDPSIMGSRASSPGGSDKHDSHDPNIKGKSDNIQVNIDAGANKEAWQNSDMKNGMVASDESDRSPAIVLDEERMRDSLDAPKPMDATITASSLGSERGAMPKSGKAFDSSFSINAFIETCVKYSETSSSLSAADDIGMNLLASVATGEMPNSEPVSPNGSPGMNSPDKEDTFSSRNAKLRSSLDDVACSHGRFDDNIDSDSEKQGKCASPKLAVDATQTRGQGTGSTSGDTWCLSPLSESKPASKHTEDVPSSGMEFHQAADPCPKFDGEAVRSDGAVGSNSPSASQNCSKDIKEEFPAGEGTNQFCEKKSANICGEMAGDLTISEEKVVNGLQEDVNMVDVACQKVEMESVEESSCLMVYEKMDLEHEKLSNDTKVKQLPPVAANLVVAMHRSHAGSVTPINSSGLENPVEPKHEKVDFMDAKRKLDSSDVEMTQQTIPEITNTSDAVDNSEKKDIFERPGANSLHEESSTIPAQEADQCVKPAGSTLSGVEADDECISTAEASYHSNATGSDMAAKLDFDLNEGFPADEGNHCDPVMITTPSNSAQLASPVPYQVSPLSCGLPASITVAAAAKGSFVPPESLLKSKGELGWKGSAATSAFRPAEPRKTLEMPLGTNDVTSCDSSAGKQSRPPLDIDLNVPDERVLEDLTSRISVLDSIPGSATAISNRDVERCVAFNSSAERSTGGLDLDLNRADEGMENGQPATSTSRRLEVPLLSVRSSSGGYANGDVNILRDFDLNNGPGIDEVGVECGQRNQLAKSSGPLQSQVSGLKVNNHEVGGIPSWFAPGAPYSAVAIPSFLPERGEQPYPFVATASAQRMMGSANGGTFGGDLYRGPVLSSSNPMAFSPAGPFPYAGLSFGNSVPLNSTSFSSGSSAFMDSSPGGGSCFQAAPCQLVGPAGTIAPYYPRPCVISIPESISGSDCNLKWGKQSLDLNAGPGSADVVGRDERLPPMSGQFSVANAQGLADERARIYQSSSGPTKRKEREGGQDADRFSFKKPSWQ